MRLKEGVRPAGQEAVRALAGRTTDAAVLGELVAGIRKVGASVCMCVCVCVSGVCFGCCVSCACIWVVRQRSRCRR